MLLDINCYWNEHTALCFTCNAREPTTRRAGTKSTEQVRVSLLRKLMRNFKVTAGPLTLTCTFLPAKIRFANVRSCWMTTSGLNSSCSGTGRNGPNCWEDRYRGGTLSRRSMKSNSFGSSTLRPSKALPVGQGRHPKSQVVLMHSQTSHSRPSTSSLTILRSSDATRTCSLILVNEHERAAMMNVLSSLKVRVCKKRLFPTEFPSCKRHVQNSDKNDNFKMLVKKKYSKLNFSK